MNSLALLMLVFGAAAGPSTSIRGIVVDGRGKPVADAQIALSPGVARDGSVRILAKAISDELGGFRVDMRGGGQDKLYREGAIWAFKPGFALAVVELIREDQPERLHRLVLEPAAARKITIRDVTGGAIKDGKVALRIIDADQTGYLGTAVPDEWLERLSVTTDQNGVAALPALSRRLGLRSVRIKVAGRGTHFVSIPIAGFKDDVTLSLEQPTMFQGEVKGSSGESIAGAEVEVWARCGNAFGEQQASYGIPERLTFDSGPIRSDASGSFKTPPVLLAGSTYRVVIRAAAHSPAVSDWIKLKKGSNSLAPIVMRPTRTILGRVVDRQGKALRGVEVFEPAGGPAITTDDAGRFRLEGARSGRWFLLAHANGYRFYGRMVDSGETTPIELALTALNERPERLMATLPELISLEESRGLARRLIAPYLKVATAKGDDAAKFRVLDIERWLNPAGLLEQVQATKFDQSSSADFLRGRAALALAADDPEEAAAIAETIAEPSRRAGTLIDLVDALAEKDKARKLDLLGRAALQARAAGLSANKLYQMGEVAERWLELGELGKAKALFAEAQTLAETLPPLKRRDAGSFSAHLARVEPEAALALAKDIVPGSARQRVLGNIASRLAIEHPEASERVLNSLEDPIWRIWGAPRICRRLVSVDLARARRIAAGLPYAAERAYAWTFIAHGLTGKDPSGASAALNQAMREIDSIDARNPYRRFDAGVAVSILPLVEQIAPERVAEVFWRGVALHAPGDDPRSDFGADYPLISEVMLFSRYDREVASTLFEPIAEYVRSRPLRGGQDIIIGVLHALACLDPRNAVAVVESLPPAKSLNIGEPTNYARYDLADILAMPPERRWMRLWRFNAGCGIAMFEEVYREL